jgi:hypothetical protein
VIGVGRARTLLQRGGSIDQAAVWLWTIEDGMIRVARTFPCEEEAVAAWRRCTDGLDRIETATIAVVLEGPEGRRRARRRLISPALRVDGDLERDTRRWPRLNGPRIDDAVDHEERKLPLRVVLGKTSAAVLYRDAGDLLPALDGDVDGGVRRGRSQRRHRDRLARRKRERL